MTAISEGCFEYMQTHGLLFYGLLLNPFMDKGDNACHVYCLYFGYLNSPVRLDGHSSQECRTIKATGCH